MDAFVQEASASELGSPHSGIVPVRTPRGTLNSPPQMFPCHHPSTLLFWYHRLELQTPGELRGPPHRQGLTPGASVANIAIVSYT